MFGEHLLEGIALHFELEISDVVDTDIKVNGFDIDLDFSLG